MYTLKYCDFNETKADFIVNILVCIVCKFQEGTRAVVD